MTPEDISIALDSRDGSAFIKLTEGYTKILEAISLLGYNVNDENFKGTATRAAKGFMELVISKEGINNKSKALLERHFPTNHDELIMIPSIPTAGICPHHLMPVLYKIWIAYIPGEKATRIIGASKLPRLVKLVSRQPLCQEDLGYQIAEFLHGEKAVIETRGCALYIEGVHTCMSARGVQIHDSLLITNALRGNFLSKPEVRAEFMSLVQLKR